MHALRYEPIANTHREALSARGVVRDVIDCIIAPMVARAQVQHDTPVSIRKPERGRRVAHILVQLGNEAVIIRNGAIYVCNGAVASDVIRCDTASSLIYAGAGYIFEIDANMKVLLVYKVRDNRYDVVYSSVCYGYYFVQRMTNGVIVLRNSGGMRLYNPYAAQYIDASPICEELDTIDYGPPVPCLLVAGV